MDRIEMLKEADRERRLFGARSHGYGVIPVLPDELDRLEQMCGCTLPGMYRSHLLAYGGGAGPYHGLMTPADILKELDSIYDSYDLEFPDDVNRAETFSLEGELSDAIGSAVEGGIRDDFMFESPEKVEGFLPICDQGCEYMTVMVTQGRFAGYVFDATCMGQSGASWQPAKRPVGAVLRADRLEIPGFPVFPTFDEWYDGWLERCLYDLEIMD